MHARSLGGAALVTLIVALPVEAQYHRSPADTLRYLEQTSGTIDMETPGGPAAIQSSHQATLAITFGPDDGATAWYEALEIEVQGPAGTQRPTTTALLDRPFELTFDDRGRVSTRSAPEIPPEVRSISDLSYQFDDFFISLPAEGLAIGTEWTDTIVQESAPGPAGSFRGHHVRTYRVERDTVVDGEHAVVIGVEQTVEIDASGEVPGQGMTTETSLRGTETGSAVFLPEAGLLHSRERSGQLEGMTRVTGSAGDFDLPQAFGYHSRISLQR